VSPSDSKLFAGTLPTDTASLHDEWQASLMKQKILLPSLRESSLLLHRWTVSPGGTSLKPSLGTNKPSLSQVSSAPWLALSMIAMTTSIATTKFQRDTMS
jgi:hypothetical protein